MIARVTITEGKNAGAEFILREGESLSFGRSESNSVQLLDGGISRTHCMLENKGGVIVLTDTGSSNGTFLNNNKVSVASVTHNDQIRIGYALLGVAIEGAGKVSDVKNLRSPWRPASEKLPSASMAVVSGEDENKGPEEVIRKKFEIDKTRLIVSSDAAKVADKDILKANENLATIYKVGNIINSATDVSGLFSTVLDAILGVIKAERGALLLRKKDSDEAEPVAAVSRKEGAGAANLKVSRTVVEEVLKSGVSILSSNAMTDDRFKSGQSIILQEIKSVMCAPLMTSDSVIGAIYVDSSSLANFFTEADLELLSAIGQQAGIAIHNARLREELKESHLETIFRLAVAAEYKDRDTAAHIHRISGYCVAIARKLGLNDYDISLLRSASPMHDVGKLGIADSILLKPGKLTPEERKIMEEHTTIGSKILQDPHSELMRISHDIALTHHEKWDGSGYPRGLKGGEIPLFGRIVALADVFDALVSKRCYKDAFELDTALSILKDEDGRHFDPACIKAFFDCLEEIVSILQKYKEQ